MSLMIAALLLAAQAADQPAATPAPAAAPAADPKKAKKICKIDEATSGSRLTKRMCLTEDEWAARRKDMTQSARSGFSGSAQDPSH